jgi:protein-S-isoprenylcysteine O-methyltransferase Ste14
MLALHFLWPAYLWNLGMTRWWGLPLAFAGFVLVVGSARGFSGKTTLRPDETPGVLVTQGFHRYSRNPMYVGMLISLVGAFVMLGSLTPLLVIPLFFWCIRSLFIAYEEQALERRFGEEYRAYKARVRRFL